MNSNPTHNLILGDCIEQLKSLPDSSVDSIITDPPYGIRFMGKAWDGSDIENKVNYRRSQNSKDPHATLNGGHNSIASEAGKYDFSLKGLKAFEHWTCMWAIEVFRVLKPGGHLISFAAPRSYHRMCSGIEDAGFEIRDQLQWIFGSGFPKSHNLNGKFEGWGTGLKPGYEPICLARKPLEGSVASNMDSYGVGAININECRVPVNLATDKSQFRTINKSSRDGTDGWGMGTNGEHSSQAVHESGRWPSNLIHDGSEEVLFFFPDSKGQQGDLKKHSNSRQSPNGIYGGMRPARDHQKRIELDQSAARFFYCAKTSRLDRNEGLYSSEKPLLQTNSTMRECENADWKKRNGNFHPTVKPTDLMRYLCRLITPKSGTVLDPFMGSGSTGKAAILEGFNFIGIEQDSEYFSIATARCDHAYTTYCEIRAQGDLFSEVSA